MTFEIPKLYNNHLQRSRATGEVKQVGFTMPNKPLTYNPRNPDQPYEDITKKYNPTTQKFELKMDTLRAAADAGIHPVTLEAANFIGKTFNRNA